MHIVPSKSKSSCDGSEAEFQTFLFIHALFATLFTMSTDKNVIQGQSLSYLKKKLNKPKKICQCSDVKMSSIHLSSDHNR